MLSSSSDPHRSPVSSTKLVPPRGNGRTVARERLLARLTEARRHRCVVVVGPAGAGKTTLLAAWHQALLPLGFDVAWLSLTPEDNELSRLLDWLVAALAHVDDAMVREAALLGSHLEDADAVERMVIALVRGIARHPRELVLVLDDFHHLSAPAIGEALQWLLDYAPPNLHLVLASRSSVRLSLERLRAQKLVLEFDLRDLRFTPAESEIFLKAQLGEIDARSARQLHERTDGWVAGLQLLSIDRKKRPSAGPKAAPKTAPSLDQPVRDATAFARYFEREVLERLSARELALLASVAHCQRFCAALCAALVGRPDAVGEAMDLLARLESDNLFIIPIDSQGHDTWYRLHPLLREALLARGQASDDDALRQVHARAWDWFRAHGHLEESIQHAVLAGESASAAALVELHAPSLFSRGERRKLIDLVRLLPNEQVQSRISLRLWLARSQVFMRELQACARSIEALSRDIPPDDADARFSLAMLSANLAVQRDDTDGALAALPQMLNPPAHADAMAIGGRNNILSWLYMHRGEYEKARRVQLDAPVLLVDGVPFTGTAGGSLQGRCLVGLSHALEGQMKQAERIYRSVLQEAEQGGRALADPACLAAALLGDALYELNDAAAARALLEDRVEVLERLSIPDSVLRVLRVLSASHWLVGHQLEAFAYLERLEEYALQHGLDRLLAYALADELQRRLELGETMAAEAVLQRLEAVDARHPDAGLSALGEIGQLAQRARIHWHLSQGDLGSAAARLQALLAECESRGHQRSVASLLIQRAVIEMRSGQAAAAHASTLAALRLGHRLGLQRSLLDADASALDLIRQASREGPFDPVLAFYVDRLEASQAQAGDAAVVPSSGRKAQAAGVVVGVESFTEREVDVLRLLAQAMPNKKIARALSLSPETVKWYLSRIYGKLRVSGRDEAVARVRDLALGTEGS
ncbi:MAG: LuxR C-terminal-related transcriptional regulator [Pseudomonadota bacterium]|jgi:LuxR family maltose regulon positive regulatory protein